MLLLVMLGLLRSRLAGGRRLRSASLRRIAPKPDVCNACYTASQTLLAIAAAALPVWAGLGMLLWPSAEISMQSTR